MIYNLIIYLYVSAVRVAALFNKKVSHMVKGEQEAFSVLKRNIVPGEKYLWFHAASLGEFEQGRPIIEEIRKRYPHYRILQTFFHHLVMRCVKIIKEQMWFAICR